MTIQTNGVKFDPQYTETCWLKWRNPSLILPVDHL